MLQILRHTTPLVRVIAGLVAGFALESSTAGTVFTSNEPISILDNSPASPYPSTIPITGLSGLISKVTVTLQGFSHSYPPDVDILLVSPSGTQVFLISDSGNNDGNDSVTNIDLTFDDAASTTIPDFDRLVTGTFQPANYGGDDAGDSFTNLTLVNPVASLAAFNGTSPNGLWRLYIVDDTEVDAGSLAGWSLNITTPESPQEGLVSGTFDSGLPTGALVMGTAALVNGAGVDGTAGLQLTAAAPNQSGDLVIDSPLGGSAVGSFTVRFDLFIGGNNQAAVRVNNQALDVNTQAGVSFSFPEGGDVIVSFNTAPLGITAIVQGVIVAEAPGVDIFLASQFVPVEIDMSATGALTVKVAGQTIFSNIQTSYIPTKGAFSIVGKTGAHVFHRQIIDNLSIQTAEEPPVYVVTKGGQPVSLHDSHLSATTDALSTACGQVYLDSPSFRFRAAEEGAMRIELGTANSRMAIIRDLTTFTAIGCVDNSAAGAPSKFDILVHAQDILFVLAQVPSGQVSVSAVLLDPNSVFGPTTTDLTDFVLYENQARDFFFDVSDDATLSADLRVEVTSLSLDLLPQAGIAVQNSAGQVRLNLKPAPNRFGTGSLQVKVTDSDNFAVTKTVQVTVQSVAQDPNFNWLNPSDITYGTTLGTAAQLNANSTIPGTYVYSPPAGTLLSAGDSQQLSVTFTPNDTVNFNPVSRTVFINVKKATLTVRADNKSRVSGTSNPQLTYSISGFANNENAGVISGTPNLSTAATADSPVGTYPIHIDIGSLRAQNYQFNPVAGVLTVNRPVLQAIAVNASKVYGDSDPPFSVTYSDLDTINGSPSFTRDPGEDVGTYTIHVNVNSLSALNHELAPVDGTLTITKKPLQISVNSTTKVYGNPDPTFTPSFSAFARSDTSAVISGTPNITRDPGDKVGAYPIRITTDSLSARNYAISPGQAGTLTITKAQLQVKVLDATKLYGNSEPGYITSFSGFKYGDKQSVVSGNVSFNRAPGEAVALYPVHAVVTTLTAENYTFAPVDGTLRINKRPVPVYVIPSTKQYGQPDPQFAATYGKFVGNDTASVVSGKPEFSRDPGQSAGTYAVHGKVGTLTALNYEFNTFVDGDLTVTKAPLVVTIDNASRPRGRPNPPFTGRIDGIVNGDVITATYLSAADASSGPGSYPISPTVFVQPSVLANYSLIVHPGTLTVTSGPSFRQPAPSGGGLQFVLSGSDGEVYLIQASTSLRAGEWHTVQTITIQGGVGTFTDNNVRNNKLLFYRALRVTSGPSFRQPAPSGGGLQFVLNGSDGEVYLIQASTSLRAGEWHTVQTITIQGGVGTFIDNNLRNNKLLFYRALRVTSSPSFRQPAPSGGGLQFVLSGNDGEVYLIQSSTTLRAGEWHTVQTITIQGGVGTFIDNNLRNNKLLFYRALRQ